MTGLVPVIHAGLQAAQGCRLTLGAVERPRRATDGGTSAAAWMTGTSPVMTAN